MVVSYVAQVLQISILNIHYLRSHLVSLGFYLDSALFLPMKFTIYDRL